MTKVLGIKGGGSSLKIQAVYSHGKEFCFKYNVLNKNIVQYCPVLFTETRITATFTSRIIIKRK